MQIQNTGGWSRIQDQDKAAKSLNRTNKDLSKILQRLSTAVRINQASDDAAGLSISQQMESQIRGFKMAQENVTDAASALQIADGAGSEVSSMVQRQRELALQSSSGTLTDTQRQDLNVEYQQLTAEIDRIGNASQFNTQSVSNGQGLASGNAQIQVGPNSGDQIKLSKTDFSAASLGISATSIANQASSQAAVTKLDTALETLNNQRSAIGSETNRFESTNNNLSVAEINTQAAQSVLADQDMAAGLMELTRQKLLLETGTQAFSRFNEISANHLFGLLQ